MQLSRPSHFPASAPIQFWLLVVFTVLVFFTGGSSRGDVQSLLVLRPASVIFCALALVTLKMKHWEERKPLLAGWLAVLLLALLHVIPLPPALWLTLPSHGEAGKTDALSGLLNVWRPLTLSPTDGLQTLASLATPLAFMLLGIQLDRDNLYRLLPLLIALGTLSGLLGLLQAIGGRDGPLYFYRLTNNGSAVGLFANRNHAAVLLACLFPLLALFASTGSATTDRQNNRYVIIAAAIAVVLVPLILVTGSRSGLLVALFGLGSAALLYRRQGPAKRPARRSTFLDKFGKVPLLIGLSVFALGCLTLWFSRAMAIDRFFEQPAVTDQRGNFFVVSNDLLWKYFPWGSGSGSFANAYQIAEPLQLLDSTYLNRAHNDWIEIAVTFGAPGLLLLALATLFYLHRSFVLWSRMNGKRRSTAFSQAAGLAMAMIAIASLSDYPLRTPTMMCVFALLSLWFTEAGRRISAKSSQNDTKGINEDFSH